MTNPDKLIINKDSAIVILKLYFGQFPGEKFMKEQGDDSPAQSYARIITNIIRHTPELALTEIEELCHSKIQPEQTERDGSNKLNNWLKAIKIVKSAR